MNKQPELTPWFPAGVRPIRKGVYELEGLPYPFHMWDGKCFDHPDHTPLNPRNFSKPCEPSEYCDTAFSCRWRGLASDPKAKP